MKTRNNFYDVLRIIGIIGVVIIHVTAENMTGAINKNVLVNNFYNSIVHMWAVPLFITITGSLVLTNSKMNIENAYKKYIPRILICFIFWHMIYYFYLYRDFNLVRCFKYLVIGETYSHLWYMYLMIGFYIIAPILKKTADNLNKKEFIYLLSIGFFINSFIPTISEMFNLNLAICFDSLLLLEINNYTFYFLLGYYLSKYEIKHYNIVLITSTLALVSLSIYQNILTINQNTLVNYSNTENIIAVFLVIGLYSLIKKIFNNRNYHFIEVLGSLTFGVYLIHFLIEKILLSIGINSNMFSPILGVPTVTLLILILSYVTCYIISKIPFINRVIK